MRIVSNLSPLSGGALRVFFYYLKEGAMKKHQSNKGFTLVEVIVVAVIVAVLAGVAIPLYINYVNDSRIASADSAAGSIATFFGAARNSEARLLAPARLGGRHVAGTIFTATNGSTVTIPAGVTVTVTGSFPAGGTVVGAHTKAPAGSIYQSFNY